MSTDRDITDQFYDPAAAHPITGPTKTNGGSVGFFAKAVQFAKENPVVAVLAGMLVLGVIMPPRKKKS